MPRYPIGLFNIFLNNFRTRLIILASGEIAPGNLMGHQPQGHLQRRKLGTIGYHLVSGRQFPGYLSHEEGAAVGNPARCGRVSRLLKPLPRCLNEEELNARFGAIKGPRDRALFSMMLRSVAGGRGGETEPGGLGPDLGQGPRPPRQRRVGMYISPDTHRALAESWRQSGASSDRLDRMGGPAE